MKADWRIFPITENVNELIQIVESKNYEIGKHFPSVALNFDE